MNPYRRIANSAIAALPVLSMGGIAMLSNAQSTKLQPTPQDTEGPFYPVAWNGDIDADLVNFDNKNYANGETLILNGRVLSIDGVAIANANVEIWQADEAGKYRHPGDDGEGPAKRGFQGYGRVRTDAEGRYSFRTIKPKLYGGRPAHVHFRVIAARYTTLTTQMYFAGENKEGGFSGGTFGGFSNERDRLAVAPKKSQREGRDVLNVNFEIVLAAQRV
jgi:protocatechuate 3,4-dioxygenase, beta subunit